jgi:hypothetical protein
MSADPTPPPDCAKQPIANECSLSTVAQTRNVLLFALTTGLYYLASPVLYIGILQANLLNELGADDVVANRPSTVYQATAPVALLAAWCFPYVWALRPAVIVAFLTIAAAGGGVAVALVLTNAAWVQLAVVGHALVVGSANGIVQTFQMEMLGRGVSLARRGQAYALAYGAGPVLAVLGSLGSDLLLEGQALGFHVPKLAFPWNYAALFGATAPLMALAALLTYWYLIPLPDVEVSRQPFVTGLFGGIREYLSDRLLVLTTLAYLLVSAGGDGIMQNVSLHTRQVLDAGQAAVPGRVKESASVETETDASTARAVADGEPPKRYVGLQNGLRFGFKVVAGFLLGWLLTRTHPKAGLLATASLYLAGLIWALVVTGPAYLVSLGLLGAGELMGVYYPNYVLCCSPPSRMRRNMALLNLLVLPAALAPTLFGLIAREHGRPSSFFAAGSLVLSGAGVVLFMLPAQPHRGDNEPTGSGGKSSETVSPQDRD